MRQAATAGSSATDVMLHEVSEPELALAMQVHNAEFDRRFGRRQEFFHGPLPTKIVLGLDEPARGDRRRPEGRRA